jgi:hypothetical protein
MATLKWNEIKEKMAPARRARLAYADSRSPWV